MRSRPRAYGTGRYGTDRYDGRDDTRYAWGRVVQPLVLFLGFLFAAAAPALAANPYCESADAATSIYGLCKPSVDVEGANPWGSKWNSNADMIETDFQLFAASSGTLQASLNLFKSTAGPLIATLGQSTETLRSSLDLFKSTAGPLISTLGQSTETIRSSLDLFKSTAGPLISTLGQSTETLRSSLDLFKSTAGPLISTLGQSTETLRSSLDLFKSTAGPLISTLGVSTGTLFSTKLASPTVSGTVGQVIALASDGTPTWTTAASGTLMTTTCAVGGITTTFTNTTFLVALTTVTATSTGKKIELSLNVSGCHTGAFSTLSCGYLQDGAFTTGHSNVIGDSFLDQATGCSEEDMVGYVTVTQTAPSAASHSWALVCRVGAGTGKLNNAGAVMAQFCAKEVP